MTHPDAHRFDSDHDFQDHIHGADKPMPYFDSDPHLAHELAWEKLPDEMLALCLLFARQDYRVDELRAFYYNCEPGFWKTHNENIVDAIKEGAIDSLVIIDLLATEYDLPQPLQAVADWVHDKLLAVWEEYHNGN